MDYLVSSLPKAIMSLHQNVEESNLSINEKHVLNQLLGKLAIYYTNECKRISNISNSSDYKFKLFKLTSRITDYIVAINDTIKGKNDVHCIVNLIYKEINYDEKTGHFKRKRLI